MTMGRSLDGWDTYVYGWLCLLLVLSLPCLGLDSCLDDGHLCSLPDCYCQYSQSPGNDTISDIPQMVLFTFTGPVKTRSRHLLMDMFPSSLRNPNGCPVGTTLFVVSQGSDPCAIHQLYARGHEVALAGLNRTAWLAVNWTRQFEAQLAHLTETSKVDLDDIVGVRSQYLRPGGDAQFRVVHDNMFVYDSSLILTPETQWNGNKTQSHGQHAYYWPFTLDRDLENISLRCLKQDCPKEAYKGLWEIPVPVLKSMGPGRTRASCTFLDDCIISLGSAADVMSLLKEHFLLSYHGNRAPFQVNLRTRSLRFQTVVDGVKDFMQYALSREDTWVVTSHQAVQWMQQPLPLKDLATSGFWACPDRPVHDHCLRVDNSSQIFSASSFRTVVLVEQIFVWQTVLLVLMFVVAYRYNKDRTEHRDNDS